MKKLSAVFTVFLLSAFMISLFALEWPTEAGSLLLLFGQENKPHKSFSNGLVFAEANTVRSSEYGTHLISIEQKNSHRNFPSALGNAEIFIHDDGLQTIYANLKDTDLFSSGTKKEVGSVIGQAGNSGWCEENALIFQVVDTKNRSFINPLLLLPAIDDKTKPQIDNIILIDKNGRKIDLKNINTINQDSYDLYANIHDRTEKSVQLSPFRVTVLINGVNVISLPFEVLTTVDGETVLQGSQMRAADLYQNEGLMYFGKLNLTSGKVELAINARDITGNETTTLFSFMVR